MLVILYLIINNVYNKEKHKLTNVFNAQNMYIKSVLSQYH